MYQLSASTTLKAEICKSKVRGNKKTWIVRLRSPVMQGLFAGRTFSPVLGGQRASEEALVNEACRNKCELEIRGMQALMHPSRYQIRIPNTRALVRLTNQTTPLKI